MTVGVLKYPGGHGDTELKQVLRQHLMKDVQEVWYKEKSLEGVEILFIGGGIPCYKQNKGKICIENSSVINILPEYSAQGKTIVGVGNGFQLLCQIGLLPGYLDNNSNEKFICKQVFIKAENRSNHLTSGLRKDEVLKLPIATEYGRYSAKEDVLVDMRRDGQIVFRFCDNQGRISESINYTGSIDNIAAVCNTSKNVFGIIPQPERAVTEFRNNSDGKTILGSFLDQLTRKN